MNLDSSTVFGIMAAGTTFVGLYNLIRKRKREKNKEIVKKNSMMLESTVSSFKICKNAISKNNVIEVNHLSNLFGEREELKNPMLILQGEKYNRGQFLPEESFIKDGQFCVGAAQYESEEQILRDKRYMKAGPKKFLYFNPEKVNAVVVTCGGLCPGLNVVIREIVQSLFFNYRCRHVYGIPSGFKGFLNPEKWIQLNPSMLKDIHREGGSILGSSRGSFNGEEIVNSLEKKKINMCFIIGGDGTHRGILEITKIVKERKLLISIVGIPKTIDNDIPIIDKSFGFLTAVEMAQLAIDSANVEATSAPYGVGLVKLMGRDAGHLALMATLCSRDVNICLLPEFKYDIYGNEGLLEYICNRLILRGHCVIVVGEGACVGCRDAVISDKVKKDPSGNIIPSDIGSFLKDEIINYGKVKKGIDITLKYIDPSYIIRGVAANPLDKYMCGSLAQNSVHSAMAGYTNFSIGIVKGTIVCIPIELIANNKPSLVKPESRLYLRMLLNTGQPSFLNDNQIKHDGKQSENTYSEEKKTYNQNN